VPTVNHIRDCQARATVTAGRHRHRCRPNSNHFRRPRPLRRRPAEAFVEARQIDLAAAAPWRLAILLSPTSYWCAGVTPSRRTHVGGQCRRRNPAIPPANRCARSRRRVNVDPALRRRFPGFAGLRRLAAGRRPGFLRLASLRSYAQQQHEQAATRLPPHGAGRGMRSGHRGHAQSRAPRRRNRTPMKRARSCAPAKMPAAALRPPPVGNCRQTRRRRCGWRAAHADQQIALPTGRARAGCSSPVVAVDARRAAPGLSQ
jgi:hypothetical protein